ncbi:hypothetical protein JCM17823_10570 [Halorubrum gandharaense]
MLIGVGAGTAALAGCLGQTDDEEPVEDEPVEDEPVEDEPVDAERSLPEYAEWIPASDDTLVFAYVDLNIESANGGDETPFSLRDSVNDPLVTFPFDIGGGTVGLYSFSLVGADLYAILDPEVETQSTATEVLVIDETVVLLGTFDSDELDERLTKDTDQFAATYDQVSDIDEYTRYKPTDVPDGLEDAPMVATSESAIIVAPDADQLERAVATEQGDHPPIAEENEDVAWLLKQAGAGDTVFGAIGPVSEHEFTFTDVAAEEPPFEPEPDEDVIASVDIDLSEDTVSSRFGLLADTISEKTEATVESSFGTAATDTTLDIDGGQIVAHGTYDAETIGLIGDDDGRGELSPEEARELVPDGALRFRYEPPIEGEFGEFWVDVVEETHATGIRIAAESGGRNEVTRQDGTIRSGDGIPTQADPDGDEVTVFAVDDDEAIGQLATIRAPTDELTDEAATEAVPEEGLAFEYDPPDAGNLGTLQITVIDDVGASVLVAQPTEAPGSFADRVGSVNAETPVETGTTLRVAVDPDGDEVIINATVDGATGEVTRWRGP